MKKLQFFIKIFITYCNPKINPQLINQEYHVISATEETLFTNLRPPSLRELTPLIFIMKLTHLGSEAKNILTYCKFITF